ncbi:MAG: hypothetical protein HY884_07170, partial [Deltaproteobacteria bacterium]|nr:hypothetical protein [Deltaproteobacteria bacterium]
RRREGKEDEAEADELYRRIGRLKVEPDRLKKKSQPLGKREEGVDGAAASGDSRKPSVRTHRAVKGGVLSWEVSTAPDAEFRIRAGVLHKGFGEGIDAFKP